MVRDVFNTLNSRSEPTPNSSESPSFIEQVPEFQSNSTLKLSSDRSTENTGVREDGRVHFFEILQHIPKLTQWCSVPQFKFPTSRVLLWSSVFLTQRIESVPWEIHLRILFSLLLNRVYVDNRLNTLL